MTGAVAARPRGTAVPAAFAGTAASPWTALHIALAVMLLTYVWRLQDLIPILGKLQVTSIATLAAFGLFVLDGAQRAAERVRHPIARLSAVILVLAALSVPGSVWPGFSFRFIIEDHVKTVIFALILASSIRSFHDVQRFAVVHVVGATLYCLTVVTRFEVAADGRLQGLIYYDGNDLAMVLVCTFPMLVYLARPGAPLLLRLGALPVLGLFVLTIVQTGSRGGFLGLIAVFATVLVGFRVLPSAHRIGALVAVAVALAVAGTDQFWERVRTLLTPSTDYNWSGQATSGRIEVWKRGVGYMLQRPVTGVGVSAFGVAEGSISPMAATHEFTGKGFKWSAAHNSFVQIGAELGVPGLIAFILLLVAAFRVALRLSRPAGRAPPEVTALAQALTATLVGYLVTGFFLSQAYSAYLYSVLAMVAGLDAVAALGAAAPFRGESVRGSSRRPSQLVGRGGLVVARSRIAAAATPPAPAPGPGIRYR